VQVRLTEAQNSLRAMEGERDYLKTELEKEQKVKEVLLSEKANLEQDLVVKTQKLTQVEDSLNRLEAQRTKLQEKVRSLTEEKAKLEEKLSTVENLKQAMIELKSKMFKVRAKPKSDPALEGNQGYILKDGTPTYPIKKKVNVIPLP